MKAEKKAEMKAEKKAEREGRREGEYDHTVAIVKKAVELGYSKEEIMKLLDLSSRSYSQIISRHFVYALST